MESVIGGVLLLLFVLAIGPAARGVSAAIDSVEDPGRPETQEEHDRGNRDMVMLLVLVVVGFGLAFALKLGAI